MLHFSSPLLLLPATAEDGGRDSPPAPPTVGISPALIGGATAAAVGAKDNKPLSQGQGQGQGQGQHEEDEEGNSGSDTEAVIV